MSLTGRYWPIHLKPLPDEMLSSWIVRIACSYSMKLHTFCSAVWGEKRQIWTRDIDKFADQNVITVLSSKTGTPYETALRTTLQGYSGYLSLKINPYGNSKHILPIGIYHRTRWKYGLQFCPICLGTGVVYYRKHWRLSFVTVCVDHGSLLHDRCEKCSSPVNFHRVNDSGNIAICVFCGFALRDSKILPAENPAWIAQERWHEILNNGWAHVNRSGSVYSFQYFDVLYQIAKAILTGKRAMRIREAIQRSVDFQCDLDLPQIHLIEELPVRNRYHLFQAAKWLMADWPNRLIEVCSRSKVWKSWLLKDMADVPYWFYRIVDDYLYRPTHETTRTEVESIKYYFKDNQISISKTKICKLLGRTQARVNN